jgi:hypothetical protein
MKIGELSKAGKVSEIDSWIFNSDLPVSEPLGSHLHWLLDHLSNIDELKNISSLRGFSSIDMFCAISADSNDCRIHLSSELLRILSRMKMDLEFSFIFCAKSLNATVDADLAAAEPQPTRSEFEERSRAALRWRLLPNAQGAVLNSLSHGSDSESLIQVPPHDPATADVDIAVQTKWNERGSPAAQLKDLSEVVHDRVRQILLTADKSTISIESRFETTCEWPSTTLTWQSFALPVLFDCPMIVEAVLVD